MFFPNANVTVDPALLVLLGLIVGTLGGFFGIGGGFLITGGLLVFGVPTIYAVGTGLALIMGNSIINVLKHRKSGNVDFRLGIFLLIGTIPALLISERLNAALEEADVVGPVIGYVYVLVLEGLGLFILYDYLKTRGMPSSQREETSTAGLAQRMQSLRIPPESITIPGIGRVPLYVSLPASGIEGVSVVVPVVIGFAVGFLAGLLGAGGGFILLPILIFVLGVPTTIAVGTGLFQIIITGAIGTVLYSLANHVDLLMVVIMLVASSVGSQLGTTATRFIQAARIRFLYAITLLGSGVAVFLRRMAESFDSLEFLDIAASTLLLSISGSICLVIALTMLMVYRERAARKPAKRRS